MIYAIYTRMKHTESGLGGDLGIVGRDRDWKRRGHKGKNIFELGGCG